VQNWFNLDLENATEPLSGSAQLTSKYELLNGKVITRVAWNMARELESPTLGFIN